MTAPIPAVPPGAGPGREAASLVRASEAVSLWLVARFRAMSPGDRADFIETLGMIHETMSMFRNPPGEIFGGHEASLSGLLSSTAERLT